VNDTLGQSAISLAGRWVERKTHFFTAAEYSRGQGVPGDLADCAGVVHRALSGWLGFCGWITRSTTGTTFSFAGTWTDFTTPIRTAPWRQQSATVDRVFRRRTYSTELGETAVLSNRC